MPNRPTHQFNLIIWVMVKKVLHALLLISKKKRNRKQIEEINENFIKNFHQFTEFFFHQSYQCREFLLIFIKNIFLLLNFQLKFPKV